MGKYKLSNGLYVAPEKDMKMLHKMSEKGYHVESLNALGFYHFVQGQPQDYIYALNTETKLREDFLEFYKESGWTPIIVMDGIQIFRATSGTTPIFTDKDSKLELLKKHKNSYVKASITTFVLLLLCTLTAFLLDFGIWEYIVWTILWIPFVFSFIPLVGLVRAEKLSRKRD